MFFSDITCRHNLL